MPKYVNAKDLELGKHYIHLDIFDADKSLGFLGTLMSKGEFVGASTFNQTIEPSGELIFDNNGKTVTKKFEWDEKFKETTSGGKRTYSRKQKSKKVRKIKSKQRKSKKNRKKSKKNRKKSNNRR